MLCLQFVLVAQNSFGLWPHFTKANIFMAGCTTEMLCSQQYKYRHWFTNGGDFFHSCCHCFHCRETHFETRYKWKESMKQLFHLCSTWQQYQWKRCIRPPFSVLFQWAASPAFPQPVKLPWQQSEQSGWGMAKRNVQWWSGRKLQKESIQWVPSLYEKMSINQAGGQSQTTTF